MRQSAVHVDVEATRTLLHAAAVQHHVVQSTVCQGGVIEAGGAESAIGLLVAKGHWRRVNSEEQ